MKQIKDSELSKMINKSPQAISYVKKTNKSEYEILRLGAFCKKANLTNDDLEKFAQIMENFK